MRLYIAEKPSMGREIAKCLQGPAKSGDGYITTAEGTVTWLFGHILRQAEPEEYDNRYKIWRSDDLPIVPQTWKLMVAEGSQKQFATVKRLIDAADEIVHAGDPDREGQLLVDEVLDYLGNKKPVRRILLNALDEKSIMAAKNNLRDNADFRPLKDSALARARADWLIGMNLSRAYTLAARCAGHSRIVMPIGRVKTPTLALVVRREREIENFKSIDHYAIKAEFAHAAGKFTAVWKPKEDLPGLDNEGRLIDVKTAETMLAQFQTAPYEATVSDYQKKKQTETPPLPFALSSLQVLAGKMFGYEPQAVLDTAQQLYEKKLTTYPRSDSEYLPVNQFGDAKTIISNLTRSGHPTLAAWAAEANLKLKSRAWNDKKITAHHAIIPTTVAANLTKLNERERNIYWLIARGYIAQFYPPHIYDQTKVSITYKEELFTQSGRTEIDLGWKAMYQTAKKSEPGDDNRENAQNSRKSNTNKKEDINNDDPEEKEDNVTLPPMQKQDKVRFENGTITKRATKPPVRFTPATLLAGMKEIHKYVKDPAAKQQLKDVYGIGTEATRAAIIDDLIRRQLLRPQGKRKYLLPQPSAYLMIDILPDELTYPDATAIWEDRLHSMSEGDGTLADFLTKQIEFTTKLCAAAETAKIERMGEYFCPRCKSVMVKRTGKNGDFWGCSAYPRCRTTLPDQNGKPDFTVRRAYGGVNNTIFTDSASYAPGQDNEIPPPVYPSEEEIAAYAAGKF